MNDFMYYSKITKKPYESLEALQEAEAAVKKAEEEKMALEAKKKEKTDEIIADIKALEEKEAELQKKIAEFTKEYGPIRLNLEKRGPIRFPFPFIFPEFFMK